MKNKQYKRILKWFETHDSITQQQASIHLSVSKISTRIGEMEAKGLLRVKRETIKDYNQFGEPTHYTKYTIIRESDTNIE